MLKEETEINSTLKNKYIVKKDSLFEFKENLQNSLNNTCSNSVVFSEKFGMNKQK